MKKFKGTQGEWKVVQLAKTDFYNERNEITFGNDGECVAEFVHNLNDAKLISAAPDMLEALQNLENDNGAIPQHAWDMIQKAIKKALGI